ncbi:MAG: hypothetical protein IPM51_06410 [Sphingobacteriaceae bacterium]|nr:hypothetical protein [Sphingobacteriaceae bacterium]
MKKTNFKLVAGIIIMGSFLQSCKKKEEPAPAPEPEIELISVTPTTLTQYSQFIDVKIKYKDNNGDLGDASPEVHSVEVKDSRLQNPDTYHLKPLAPSSDKNIPIEGEVTIKLNTLFLLGQGNSEITTLKIKIKDRAGNWSNEISSPSITINK